MASWATTLVVHAARLPRAQDGIMGYKSGCARAQDGIMGYKSGCAGAQDGIMGYRGLVAEL